MAIITFKSNEQKETGQTLSLIAVATQMAIEHSYKILVVSTNFKDQTLENCYWELERLNKPVVTDNKASIGVDSGIEGLIKVLVSNKTSNDIVRNYSKTVLRERLDVLLSPRTEDYSEYTQICNEYPEILRIADRYYDLIFVDLSSRMQDKERDDIINISDVIVVNLTQRLKTINDFVELRENNDFYKGKNILLIMGRYDAHSKYNVKNVTRYMKEKKQILAIPYNTLYFEACSEGKAIEFFLRLKNLEEGDRNRIFVNEANRADDAIIYKLQELQMKI